MSEAYPSSLDKKSMHEMLSSKQMMKHKAAAVAAAE